MRSEAEHCIFPIRKRSEAEFAVPAREMRSEAEHCIFPIRKRSEAKQSIAYFRYANVAKRSSRFPQKQGGGRKNELSGMPCLY